MKVRFLCESYEEMSVAEKRASSFFQKFFIDIFEKHSEEETMRVGISNVARNFSAGKCVVFKGNNKMASASYSANVKVYASQVDAVKGIISLAAKVEKEMVSKFKSVKKTGTSKKGDFAIKEFSFIRGKQAYTASMRFTFKPSDYAAFFIDIFQSRD